MMIYHLTYLAAGVLLGLAVLPWKQRLGSREGVLLWLLAWACFWPYLLLCVAWQGLKAYRAAWWAYTDRKHQ